MGEICTATVLQWKVLGLRRLSSGTVLQWVIEVFHFDVVERDITIDVQDLLSHRAHVSIVSRVND